MTLAFLAALYTYLGLAAALSKEGWRSQSIYQLLTDRYARTNGSEAPCSNLGGYCGGSWQGIINNLDYIQTMGFTAIWISPITENIQDYTRYGAAYHGFWPQKINEVNSNFGTAADLKALSNALHERGMYLMVDMVTNDMAWNGNYTTVDYSIYDVFNDSSYYHPYCQIYDYQNYNNTVNCWSGDQYVSLPDLAIDTTLILNKWEAWVSNITTFYGIDGIRLDACLEQDQQFFTPFETAAGVYIMCEVYDYPIAKVCDYQNYVSGLLNFPIWYLIIDAFSSNYGNITNLYNGITEMQGNCTDVSLLGNFVENHDVDRFPYSVSDSGLDQNAIAFAMLNDGFPIIYAGEEQYYSGGFPPADRETTWTSGYATTTIYYQLIKKMNEFRACVIGNDATYLTTNSVPFYLDTQVLGTKKGSTPTTQVVAVFNNRGIEAIAYNISMANTGWTAGDVVYEIYTEQAVTVDSNNDLPVYMYGGQPRIYYIQSELCTNLGGTKATVSPTPSTTPVLLPTSTAATSSNVIPTVTPIVTPSSTPIAVPTSTTTTLPVSIISTIPGSSSSVIEILSSSAVISSSPTVVPLTSTVPLPTTSTLPVSIISTIPGSSSSVIEVLSSSAVISSSPTVVPLTSTVPLSPTTSTLPVSIVSTIPGSSSSVIEVFSSSAMISSSPTVVLLTSTVPLPTTTTLPVSIISTIPGSSSSVIEVFSSSVDLFSSTIAFLVTSTAALSPTATVLPISTISTIPGSSSSLIEIFSSPAVISSSTTDVLLTSTLALSPTQIQSSVPGSSGSLVPLSSSAAVPPNFPAPFPTPASAGLPATVASSGVPAPATSAPICPSADGITFTANGQEFVVGCGIASDQEYYAQVPGTDIADCVHTCTTSTSTPACQAVTYSQGICYLKTEPGAVYNEVISDSAFVIISQNGPEPIASLAASYLSGNISQEAPACPDGNRNTFESHGYVFVVACNFDNSITDTSTAPGADLASCVESCISLGDTQSCATVTYNSGTCHFKDTVGTVFHRVGADTAFIIAKNTTGANLGASPPGSPWLGNSGALPPGPLSWGSPSLPPNPTGTYTVACESEVVVYVPSPDSCP